MGLCKCLSNKAKTALTEKKGNTFYKIKITFVTLKPKKPSLHYLSRYLKQTMS